MLPTGRIKTIPADFFVAELPRFTPDGRAGHVLLRIRKKGLSTPEMIGQLSRLLGCSVRDIGSAGLKDKHADTIQWISVPQACSERIAQLESPGIEVLETAAHSRKLRTGQLAANRFRILVRPTGGTPFSRHDHSAVSKTLLELSQCGFPNVFGPQRFGRNNSTVDAGLRLLRDPPRGSGKRKFHRLALSAVQSRVFNQVVLTRSEQGTLWQIIDGDIVIRRGGARPFAESGLTPPQRTALQKHDPNQSGPSPTDPDADLFVPAGPLPGPKMPASSGSAAEIEERVLRELQLTPDAFSRKGTQTPGTRRPMLIWPQETSAALTDDGICLQWTLPPGCYATVLLQHLFSDLREGPGDGQ